MLPILLSRVLCDPTAALNEPPALSLAVWPHVMRRLPEGGAERDLPTAARISKRLAVAAVIGAARPWMDHGREGRLRPHSRPHRHRQDCRTGLAAAPRRGRPELVPPFHVG